MNADETLEIAVISDSAGFEGLREDWTRLLARSRSRCVFLSWDWLYTWWLSYGGKDDLLHILVVRENGEAIGIAPIYVRRRNLDVFREIVFLGSNVVCSDYLDFILMEGREEESLSAILRFLQKDRKHWDVISLTDIPSTSESLELVEGFFGNGRVQVNRAYTECPYIDLGGGWEGVLQGFSRSLRTNLGRKVRKFNKQEEAGFFTLERGEDLDPYFDEFVRLNTNRMVVKEKESPFLKQDFLDFHRRILREFLDRGMAKVHFLKLGDDLIAGIYLLVYGDKVHYYQSGFDPSWAKLSPGMVLFDFSIRDAVESGAKEFDFLQGNEAYKDTWTKTKRFNAELTIYSDTTKGRAASLVTKGMDGARSVLRPVRDKLLKSGNSAQP